jgi:hypothetical protein
MDSTAEFEKTCFRLSFHQWSLRRSVNPAGPLSEEWSGSSYPASSARMRPSRALLPATWLMPPQKRWPSQTMREFCMPVTSVRYIGGNWGYRDLIFGLADGRLKE